MTGKLSFSAIRNMTVLIVARRVKRHLTAQHQDEEFEQQGEAIEPIPLHTSPRVAELPGVAGTFDKDGYLL